MSVLFSNPPWWEGRRTVAGPDRAIVEAYIGGVRAGSRWPFTTLQRDPPDTPSFRGYLPYPFFMGYAAT